MTRLGIFLLWALHLLPLRALAALGNGIGRLAFWLVPERRSVARINLAKCFPQIIRSEKWSKLDLKSESEI